jgi:hypothetical protein
MSALVTLTTAVLTLTSAVVAFTTCVMTLTTVVVTRTTAVLTLTSGRMKHTSASKKQTLAPVAQTNALVSATLRRVPLKDHRFPLIRAAVRGARAPLEQTATRMPLTNAANKHVGAFVHLTIAGMRNTSAPATPRVTVSSWHALGLGRSTPSDGADHAAWIDTSNGLILWSTMASETSSRPWTRHKQGAAAPHRAR